MQNTTIKTFLETIPKNNLISEGTNTIIRYELKHKGYKYIYQLKDLWLDEYGDHLVLFTCKWARMNQEFLLEDIQGIIDDLPNIIDLVTTEKRDQYLKLRINEAEKIMFEQVAKNNNMNMTELIKHAVSLLHEKQAVNKAEIRELITK